MKSGPVLGLHRTWEESRGVGKGAAPEESDARKINIKLGVLLWEEKGKRNHAESNRRKRAKKPIQK